MTGGWVYILSNRPGGVLYTGVTANLAERLAQHRAGAGSKFARRYNCFRLVFAERHGLIGDAIWREKCIKKWSRAWKVRMIEDANPDWCDLATHLHLA